MPGLGGEGGGPPACERPLGRGVGLKAALQLNVRRAFAFRESDSLDRRRRLLVQRRYRKLRAVRGPVVWAVAALLTVLLVLGLWLSLLQS